MLPVGGTGLDPGNYSTVVHHVPTVRSATDAHMTAVPKDYNGAETLFSPRDITDVISSECNALLVDITME